MKSITFFLSLAIFAVSCTSVRTFDETTANYDDTYYNPDDEKAPAPKPASIPAEPYRFKETSPETRIIEPTSPSASDQQNSDLSDRTTNADREERGYASDGYSYEEHFGRMNGNRSYNRGYREGYEDALDDQYFYDDFYSYRAPVYYNTWRRGWNRPYYRSYPRNNFWIGYSHRSGWRYGYSYGWGYNGWNCYGPAWYDPYPWGYGGYGYSGWGGYGNFGYGGWGYGYGGSWYGHNGFGWGSPWYGNYGGYYRPYAHYPYYGHWGGYRNVNPPSGGGGSGSGGGIIIQNPGQGTVHAPRTTVGSNGPTIGRNDQGSPRGRSGKLEAPGNDGAMNPTQGGLKESVARPDLETGQPVKDGNDQGRGALPQETGPQKSDDRPGMNQPNTRPEQGRQGTGSDRTPVSNERPNEGSLSPGSGEKVREYKPEQPTPTPVEQGREGRNSNERIQPNVNPSREYHPSRESVPSKGNDNVRPTQPRQETPSSEDNRRYESRPTPSYERDQPSRGNDNVRPSQPRQESRPSEDNRRYESRPTPSYERNQPSRGNDNVRPSQPRQESRPTEDNRRYESRPTPSYERPSRVSSPSRGNDHVRPSQPRQESRPQPSYTPSPQRSQPSGGNFGRESSPSPSRSPSPASPGSGNSSSGRGRSPR